MNFKETVAIILMNEEIGSRIKLTQSYNFHQIFNLHPHIKFVSKLDYRKCEIGNPQLCHNLFSIILHLSCFYDS
jgi:hypothetical protein